jgi:23S rRNA (cytidine1920-2'-O)/16S rRNA (cytidine1409-2'-O)-methyltransferase
VKTKEKSKPLAERVMEESHGALSREDAERRIRAGLVRVNGEVSDKPGTLVKPAAAVTVEGPREHVGRGALKLEAALDSFAISPEGRACADVGACTGGFTEILLKRGARRVFAIDVGYGDLAWKIRSDPRVTVMERTNARYIEKLDEPVSLVTVDVSFISLTKVLPAIVKWLEPSADLVTLVKPQFEADPGQVGEGGIVRDPKVHEEVVQRIRDFLPQVGLIFRGLEQSPILGSEGNTEFLMWSSR